jgi:hypothetical protein
MSTPQKWIDANPCSLCGKPLNAPHGRKRENAAYVRLEPRSSGGDKAAHDFMRNRREVFVGVCCLGRFAE